MQCYFGSCIKCYVHNNLVLNHKRTCSGGTESFQNNTCILGKFTMLMKMIHCLKGAVNPLYMVDDDMDETRKRGESQMKHRYPAGNMMYKCKQSKYTEEEKRK